MRLGRLGRLILSCFVSEAPGVQQLSVLTCQGISLIDLDGDDALWIRHLHSSIGSVDDRH
jgi:hypothetical protein